MIPGSILVKRRCSHASWFSDRDNIQELLARAGFLHMTAGIISREMFLFSYLKLCGEALSAVKFSNVFDKVLH